VRLRAGRKLSRTIYLQLGDEPSDDDELLGLFLDPARADLVVKTVNGPSPPSRSPDPADLALAKIAVPWMGLHQNTPPHPAGNAKLAQALAAWLTARGIY
jgi:hypothetical protein